MPFIRQCQGIAAMTFFDMSIPRSAAERATKNLDSLLSHVSTFDLYSGGLIPNM